MKLHVRLFAAARQLAERESLDLECPTLTTVGQLREAVAEACPALSPLLPHVRFAVNERYAADGEVVRATDRIACIPPVSGG